MSSPTLHLWVMRAANAFHSSVTVRRRVGAIGLILFGVGVAVYYLIAPPENFIPVNSLRIAPGTNGPVVAQELADAHIIAHPEILRMILHLTGTSGDVRAGVYHFNTPETALGVAYRLATGAYGFPPVRITFVEGTTVREMAERLASSTLAIPASSFVATARAEEGYLFPDTYFFQPSADPQSIVAEMHRNFNNQITPLLPVVDTSGHSLSQIITMASLVEREARATQDRKIVAGILWNRIKRGMPLQVDAVFGYIFDKPTYSPSLADLKVDSPYNTYTHIGLPPGPICNPGLDAIEATLHPTQSRYLYYLTGKDGKMHYATTYAGHLANERRYL